MAKLEDIRNAIQSLKDYQVALDNDSIKNKNKVKEDVINAIPQFVRDARKGRIIEDDDCLILSAPKIIIGNVDKSGRLKGSGCEITLRGENVNIQATGDQTGIGGNIECKAASIRQLAVDPGLDGTESIVCKNRSEIVSQAHNVNIYGSEDFGGVFIATPSSRNSGLSVRQENVDQPNGKPTCGVTIHSDMGLQLEATPSFYEIKDSKEAILQSLDVEINGLIQKRETQYNALNHLLSEVYNIFEADNEFARDDDSVRTKTYDLESFNFKLDALAPILSKLFDDFYKTSAVLINKSLIKQQLNEVDFAHKAEEFVANSNNTNLQLLAESINLKTIDGDRNHRKTPNAGVLIESIRTQLKSLENGLVEVLSPSLILDTCTVKTEVKNNKTVPSSMTAGGKITLRTNDLSMEAPCVEYKNGAPETSGISQTSKLSVQFANTVISATGEADSQGKPSKDKHGKAFGSIKLDAKDIEIGAFDYNKEDQVDTLSEGGNVSIAASTVEIGGLAKDVQYGSDAKKLQSSFATIHANKMVNAYVSPDNTGYKMANPALSLTDVGALMMFDDAHGFMVDKSMAEILSGSSLVVNDSGTGVTKALNVADKLSVNGDISTAGNVSCKQVVSNQPGSAPKTEESKAVEENKKSVEDMLKSLEENHKKLIEEDKNKLEAYKKQKIDALDKAIANFEALKKESNRLTDQEVYQQDIDRYTGWKSMVQELTAIPKTDVYKDKYC